MYGSDVRRNAVALMEHGISLRSISMSIGISRATLHDWREHPEISTNPRAVRPRCAANPTLPIPSAAYAYLLGLQLGDGCTSDGCTSLACARDKGVWKLRIICSDTWPGLLLECERAMSIVRPASKVRTQQNVGRTEVMITRHFLRYPYRRRPPSHKIRPYRGFPQAAPPGRRGLGSSARAPRPYGNDGALMSLGQQRCSIVLLLRRTGGEFRFP